MTRVNLTSSSLHSHTQDDSDALELALAFVDEFNLLGDDQEVESTARSDVTAVASATATSPSSQTRKSEPTSTTPRAMAGSEAPGSAPKALNRKDELTYLRAKVRELHVRLELLQNTSNNRSEGTADDEEEKKALQQRSLSPQLLAQHRTMWENLANRQSNEREKVERENAQLKTLLESQLKVAKVLERMLKKRGNVEIFRPSGAFKKIKLCRGDSPGGESALLKESSNELDNIYADVDQLIERTGLDTMASTSQDTQMKKDAEIGCHVQIIDNNLLEFDVKTVSDAVWMFVSQEGMKSVCYHHEEFEASANTVGRFFGMKIKEKQAKCDLRGVNIARRYASETRTVIVWITIIEPVAFSGVPIAGIRFRESGVLILTPGAPLFSENNSQLYQQQQMKSSTQMRMCCRLVPDMDASSESSLRSTGEMSADQTSGSGGGGGVVGAVTDFLINSIEGNIGFTNMMIDKLLRHRQRALSEGI